MLGWVCLKGYFKVGASLLNPARSRYRSGSWLAFGFAAERVISEAGTLEHDWKDALGKRRRPLGYCGISALLYLGILIDDVVGDPA